MEDMIYNVERAIKKLFSNPLPNPDIKQIIELNIHHFVTADKFVQDFEYFFNKTIDFEHKYFLSLSNNDEENHIVLFSNHWWRKSHKAMIVRLYEKLSEDNWTASQIRQVVKEFFDTQVRSEKQTKDDIHHIYRNLRFILTGEKQGPKIFDVMAILGKEVCLERIYGWERIIQDLKKGSSLETSADARVSIKTDDNGTN